MSTLRPCDVEPDFQVELPGGDGEVRGVHHCPAFHQRRGHHRVRVVPISVPAVVVVGSGVGAGGQGLSQAWRSVAGTDVTVPADGVGELDEPSVLFGDLEAGQPPWCSLGRRPAVARSSGSPWLAMQCGSVVAVELQPGSAGAGGSAGTSPDLTG